MDFELYGSHFEYDGVSSRNYNLIFANIETSRNLLLSGQRETVVVFNKRDKKNYFVTEKYDDSPLEFEAEIVTDDDEPISYEDRRFIERWLFHQPGYRKLYIDPADDCYGKTTAITDGEEKRVYLNCRLINPEKIESGTCGIIGYKFTIQCDSHLAYRDATQKEFTITGTNENTFTINVDTDLVGYTYPIVKIYFTASGGKVDIANKTDSETRLTSFAAVSPGEWITMNKELNYVSGDNYTKFVNRNFIRLLNGENIISVSGNVEKITFEWNDRLFL